MTNTFTQPTSLPSDTSTIASGPCRKCRQLHSLGPGGTHSHCLELMDHLSRHETIDLHPSCSQHSHLGTEYLFGKARGKMFGILECRRSDGSKTVLRAFSGQYNGLWEVPGWVPPLFDTEEFARVNTDTEKQIKELGRILDSLIPDSPEWLEIRRQRRQMSRELMRRIHKLYRLTNFQGQTATLFEAYIDTGGIPTGTGDCCAPKLLNYAARHNLTPTGITEFYWGRENRAQTRQHGSLYSSCADKCQPILGFQLCGLDYHDAKE